jgi:peroxiredoxin
VSIVAVGFDSPEDNQEWADDEGYLYEIWTDDERTLATTYEAVSSETQSFPSRVTKLLDADGVLILEYVDNIEVGTHPGQVLADCQAIFGG